MRCTGQVAPPARYAGQDLRCGAIAGGVGEGGGQGRESVGVLVRKRFGKGVDPVALEEGRVGVTREERRMAQDAHEEVAVGDDAVEARPGERAGQRSRRLPASLGDADHLGEQRVVVDADLGPGHHTRVEANARHRGVGELHCNAGHLERVQGPAVRVPTVGRILGIEPDLDGVSGRHRRRRREAGALGDADLQGNEIDAGGALGDGVLDLEPGVHLQEEEAAVVTGKELDGAGAGVADRPGGRDRGGEQRLAHPRHPLDER